MLSNLKESHFWLLVVAVFVYSVSSFEDDDEIDPNWDDGDDTWKQEEDFSDVSGLGPGESGKISFSTPDLNDEEFHSMHLPSALKCDACSILAFMMTDKFEKAHEKRPSLSKNLPESEIIDMLEEVCNDEFQQVGIKEVKGQKRLQGPGSPLSEVPGIMQGGGKWPVRMHTMCHTYIGEIGEEEIYEAYKKGKLKKLLCYRKGADCYQKQREKEKLEAKKAKSRKTVKVEL